MAKAIKLVALVACLAGCGQFAVLTEGIRNMRTPLKAISSR